MTRASFGHPPLRRLGARTTRTTRLLVPCLGLVFAGLLACCSSSAGGTTVASQRVQRPLPAGRHASQISRMVCTPRTQREIAETLGVRAAVSTPTWTVHAYSCRYAYRSGAFVLTVKELSSWPQTFAYYAGIGHAQGRTATIRNLGQGAFQTTNGSAIVRKDWKVLTVDISDLPAQFGRPPTSRGDVAVTVADLILACWAGD